MPNEHPVMKPFSRMIEHDTQDRDHPVVEREFETNEKGRTMVVCSLCGEVRPYKTKGEGRCCMRTTHDWRPIAKK